MGGRIIAAVIALAGCSADASVDEHGTRGAAPVAFGRACLDEAGRGRWHVDRASWPADHLAVIDTVPARVNAWVGRDVLTFDDAIGDTCVIRTVPTLDRGDGVVYTAFYLPDTGSIPVVLALVPACEGEPNTMCTSSIVLHEVLHGFGLDHVPSGIMQARAPIPTAFSADDRAECVRAGLCDQ